MTSSSTNVWPADSTVICFCWVNGLSDRVPWRVANRPGRVCLRVYRVAPESRLERVDRDDVQAPTRPNAAFGKETTPLIGHKVGEHDGGVGEEIQIGEITARARRSGIGVSCAASLFFACSRASKSSPACATCVPGLGRLARTTDGLSNKDGRSSELPGYFLAYLRSMM